MGVLFSNDAALEVPLSEEAILAAVSAVLENEGVERSCEVGVTVVDEAEMAALNGEWRGIEAPTDVLSFACESPFDDEVPTERAVELGDIVLAPGVIREQAPQFNNSFAQEFELMLVHGMLHLLGYDHVDEEGALEMEAAELAVLQKLAMARGEDPDAVHIGPTTRHAEDFEEGAA